MGKKGRRNNAKPKDEGKEENVADVLATMYSVVYNSFLAQDFDTILKLESRWGHLKTFGVRDDPTENVLILHAFGTGLLKEGNTKRSMLYYQKAMDIMNSNPDEEFHSQVSELKDSLGMNLARAYSRCKDADKTITIHRWFLQNCNRNKAVINYILYLGRNFTTWNEHEYAIEVFEGFVDMLETFEMRDRVIFLNCLIVSYTYHGELIKATAVNDKLRLLTRSAFGLTNLYNSGQIEMRRCNFRASVTQFREAVNAPPLEDKLLIIRDHNTTQVHLRLDLALALLKKHSAANEAEAFQIFQKELDNCQHSDRQMILFHMGEEYSKLKQWKEANKTLQLCLFASRKKTTAISLKANEVLAKTYLEQYCVDAALDTYQRREVLKLATSYSRKAKPSEITTGMHLTRSQLFYFNGDKQQAYRHLEKYLDARLAECKLHCYTCEQRVRTGSVPRKCESCKVALYCDSEHQKMTWKNERLCHKVLCPLLGFWRKARKKKDGMSEDRCESVFRTFFSAICIKCPDKEKHDDGLSCVECVK